MRILVDAHGEKFWSANLYNLWMGALRELSTRDAAALPAVARTEAWGRRILNAQLASWAELRHDTILYAKQSYTGGATCEFPDAYVEPNPDFFAAIGRLAAHGEGIVAGLDLDTSSWLSQAIVRYFQRLAEVSSLLEEMATHQRDGLPLTEEHLAFINRAVRIQWGCGDPEGAEGWYADLFFSPAKGVEYDPTIADVHTQPTDEAGNMVGRVLHVGTGKPRLAVITVDTCAGPRAYAGLVSSYFERVTENFERIDDPTWAAELQNTTPPEGWHVNIKRVYRLYKLEGLGVERRKRKKRGSVLRVVPEAPTAPNQRWSMDFVQDSLLDGRKFRVLTIVDVFTRECLALHADFGLDPLP